MQKNMRLKVFLPTYPNFFGQGTVNMTFLACLLNVVKLSVEISIVTHNSYNHHTPDVLLSPLSIVLKGLLIATIIPSGISHWSKTFLLDLLMMRYKSVEIKNNA